MKLLPAGFGSRRWNRALPLGMVVLLASCVPPGSGAEQPRSAGADLTDRNWEAYLGDAASTQYSGLDQIDRENVHRLQVAWIHHTGDATERSRISTNPLIIDGVLFGISPGLSAFALDAATGRELWSFRPAKESLRGQGVNRGFTYWSDGDDRRLFFSAGARLYALNAATGAVIPSFGVGGSLDLGEGLGRDSAEQAVFVKSPGVIYGDLLIQGTTVSEARGAAPGDIRAFDVRTGEQKWIFHTIPHPGEFGYESWPADAWRTAGGANAWPGVALDAERGIVYVPTGAPSIQYYGGDIPGENLFSSTLLALNARTGERIWHFQIHHHDIFDRDLPAPPNLVTVTHDGRRIDAVAQVTKTGSVFLFDRATGEPLFPVEERPVPASPLAGEAAWPTQPFPTLPAPFVRQTLTEADLTTLTPEANAAARERFRQLRVGGPFNPPSLEGSLFLPMMNGGAEWGGAAVDPVSGVLYVNANDLPQILTMGEPAGAERAAGPLTGHAVFATYCSGCHGAAREGGAGPALRDLPGRMSSAEVLRTINAPQGFMPSFSDVLSAAEKDAVIAYLLGLEQTPAPTQSADADGVAPAQSHHYRVSKNERFVDAEGYPASAPPWGTLSAIDLNSGATLWRVPLGEYPELTARGIPPTGTENYGGPVVTAGGLIFIGATKDGMFRALDRSTGEVLWETKLPFGGFATPAVYAVNGRQYVVIAAGGGPSAGGWAPTPSGDAYVAFALPE